MAQLVKRDHDVNTLWAKGLEAKKAGQLKDCIAAIFSAKALSIAWVDNTCYWKWESIYDPISHENIDVAELIQVCFLQISGSFNVNNLARGLVYGVFFILKLDDNLCTNGPVTLNLTLPNGKSLVHTEDLGTQLKNVWIPVMVDQFLHVATCDENIVFSLNGADDNTWKTGLTVIGAVIVPL